MYFFKISQTFKCLDLHCLRQKTVTQCDLGLVKIAEGASPHRHAVTSPVKVKDTHLMNNKLPPAEILCGECTYGWFQLHRNWQLGWDLEASSVGADHPATVILETLKGNYLIQDFIQLREGKLLLTGPNHHNQRGHDNVIEKKWLDLEKVTAQYLPSTSFAPL